MMMRMAPEVSSSSSAAAAVSSAAVSAAAVSEAAEMLASARGSMLDQPTRRAACAPRPARRQPPGEG